MTDSGNAFQAALFEVLTSALSVPVYDAVPEGSTFPYVVIGDDNAVESDSFSTTRDDRTIRLTVWSAMVGKKEVREIAADIRAALHRQRLTLTTGRLVHMWIEREQITRDADGRSFMANLDLRAEIER